MQPRLFILCVYSTLLSNPLTGALSTAVTARAGGVLIRLMVWKSTLSAVDSNPTSIINAVGDKDGLCDASNSLFVKSLPQPSGSTSLSEVVRQLEQGKGGCAAAGGPVGLRMGGAPPPPQRFWGGVFLVYFLYFFFL